MAIKRGIDAAVGVVVKELQNLSKPTQDQREIAQVGTISANNDETIGKIIAEAMNKVGKEGVITVEEAKSMETTLEVVEGFLIFSCQTSPSFFCFSSHRFSHKDVRLLQMSVGLAS